MGYTIRLGLTDYHFVKRDEEVGCKQRGATHNRRDFGSHDEAVAFLRPFLDNFGEVGTLRRMALDLLPGLSGPRLTDQDILLGLARLLVAGSVSVIQCVYAQAPALPREAEAPSPPPRPKPPRPATVRHWIEFKVLDEKTRRPVPEVTLRVTLPGRGEESHTTEAKTLHISLASAGTADLLEMTHADVWEVVEIQSG